MDHERVFEEYAESDVWVVAHLAQFAGFGLVFTAVALLSWSLTHRPPPTSVLGAASLVLASASLAGSGVLQAVDGIALKAMVDAWAGAPTGERTVAFAAAKAVRWIEIGISSHFRILQGTTFVSFGAALAADQHFPRWFGWIGAVAGLGMVLRGFAIASTGFSLGNPVYLYSEVLRIGLYLWLVGLAVLIWRRSTSTP